MRLQIIDAHFSYSGRDAVSGVSYALADGMVTGLIGPNGSGKTTLLKLMSGELRPTSGQVLLDGGPVFQMNSRQRARNVAVVPQKSSLEFDFTVLDMVLMGRQMYFKRFQREDARDIELARESMAQLGITDLAGRNARGLSGGEWQRVLIARALCQGTKLLLLDEPVSSLDIRHQMEVLSIISKLARERGAAVAIVLHDLNLAAHYCDRLVMLNNGALVSQGSPEQVLTEDKIREVYGISSIVEREGNSISVKPIFI